MALFFPGKCTHRKQIEETYASLPSNAKDVTTHVFEIDDQQSWEKIAKLNNVSPKKAGITFADSVSAPIIWLRRSRFSISLFRHEFGHVVWAYLSDVDRMRFKNFWEIHKSLMPHEQAEGQKTFGEGFAECYRAFVERELSGVLLAEMKHYIKES